MNRLALAYLYTDLNKRSQMAGRAITLANKISFKNGPAEASLVKGYCLILIGHSQNALDTLQKALYLFERLDDTKGLAKTAGNMGRAYYGLSYPAKALEFGFHALKIGYLLNDPELLGDIFNNLGNSYRCP